MSSEGKPPSRMDELAEGMFQCLPANSHVEILKRLRKEMKEPGLQLGMISQVLLYIRRNKKRVGFDVVHSPRGRMGKDDEGFRFQASLVDSSGKPYLDPAGKGAMIAGIVGTVRMIMSLAKNEKGALEVAKQYLSSMADLRALNIVIKHLGRIDEDSEELEEFVHKLNGTK